MIAAGVCFRINFNNEGQAGANEHSSFAVTLNVNEIALVCLSVSTNTDRHPSYQWAQKPPCGSFLELRRKKELPSTRTPTTAPTAKPTKYSDSVIVRVMDSCAGCKAGTAHVDLTKAAFKSLYALDIG
jgi:hypothetical protein